jgi:hypothetical protein
MVWFLERDRELMVCEIRQATDRPEYEFELAPREGKAETLRFSSARELLEEYPRRHNQLLAEGWRPRVADIRV